MNLANQNYKDVEKYLRKNRVLLIPIGSTEQHSPDGLLGTDYLIAQALAERIGEKMGFMVSPPLPFGIAVHHLDFPGTVTLRPSTLITLLLDMVQSWTRQGFREYFIINGHGGNIPTVKSFFSEITLNHKIKLDIVNWWHLDIVKEKEQELFGPHNGFHATISEISITRFLFPALFLNDKGEAKAPNEKKYQTHMPHHAWPLSPQGFRKLFPKGNMGSMPNLASADKGRIIFDLAVETIIGEVRDFLRKKY